MASDRVDRGSCLEAEAEEEGVGVGLWVAQRMAARNDGCRSERKTGRQAGRQADRQTGRQGGRQAGRRAGWQCKCTMHNAAARLAKAGGLNRRCGARGRVMLLLEDAWRKRRGWRTPRKW